MTANGELRLTSAEKLEALQEGVDLIGVSADIRLTNNFETDVNAATGRSDYSDNRGIGVVAAKAIDTTIWVNNAVVGDSDAKLLRRLGAHEACHVLVSSREDDIEHRRDLADTEWHGWLLQLGANALEEARIERHMAQLGMDPSDVVEYGSLELRLFNFTERAVLSIIDEEISLWDMIGMGLGVMDELSKVLAYMAGAQIEGTFQFDDSKLSTNGAARWKDLVGNTWERRLEFYESLPTAVEPLQGSDWNRAVLMAAELEHAQLRSLGFEFRNRGADWGYFRLMPRSRWERRIEHLLEDAGKPAY